MAATGPGKFNNLGIKTDDFFCTHKDSRLNWADVNGDGKMDMICDDYRGNHWVRLSKGDGTWDKLGMVLMDWCKPRDGNMYRITTWADSDGDGKADIHCDDSRGYHSLLTTKFSNGKLSFQNVGVIAGPAWCKLGHLGNRVHWVDINGDGKADMVCSKNNGDHHA